MEISKEEFDYLQNKYVHIIQDMLRQNMPFFKFRKQPIWGFMFDERVAILGQANKAQNIVSLNLAAIDFSIQRGEPLMIEQFALHEFRHLYQYGEIEKYKQGNYDGSESIDTVERWAYEHEHYIGPEKDGKSSVNDYYEQDLEFDAFTFAYSVMTYKYMPCPDYIRMPKYYTGKYESAIKVWHKKFNKMFEA